MRCDAEQDRVLLRLRNSSAKEKTVTIKLLLYGTETQVSMRPCGLYTYQIDKHGIIEIDPVTNLVK